MQGVTDDVPAELTVTSGVGVGGMLPTSLVDGVTATAQALTAVELPTSGHTVAHVATVVGPTSGRFFVDPAATRATVNRDGVALAAALTAALPDLEKAASLRLDALNGDPEVANGSTEVTDLIARMNKAIAAAPGAGDLLLDQPSYKLDGLAATGDSSITGAAARVAVDRFQVGGLLTASGFSSSASIDLVAGEGVNGRSTRTVPTFDLLGLPVLQTLTTADGLDENVDVVDTSALPALVRQSVTTSLAGVSDAARLLVRDAGLIVAAEDAADGGDPSMADTGYLHGSLGDLPAGPDGSPSGHDILVGFGSGVGTACLAGQGPVIPDPTATPGPTATPTPTPTPTPPAPVKHVVKRAPKPVVTTTNTPAAG